MKKTDLFFAFILIPLDIAMIIASFVLAYYLRIGLETAPSFNNIGLEEYLRYSFYLIPFWILLLSLNGLYSIKPLTSFYHETYRIFSASSTAMLILIVQIFLLHTSFFSRLVLIFTWIISIFMISLGRLLIKMIKRYFFNLGIGRTRVLLIGNNETSQNINEHFINSYNNAFKMVGVLNTNGDSENRFGLKIVGNFDEFDEKVKNLKVDEIVLTNTDIPKTKILKIIQFCTDRNIGFKYIPDSFSLMSINVSPNLIGTMPVMELRQASIDGWGRILKRVFDLLFSSILLVILSPIFLIIAILVKLTSEGPIFYKQGRVGRDENIFFCHKFRSMTENAEKKQKWTTKDDPYVTPLGKFLRKSNLDEIPQFWDILIGNMSFVGPRPEQPEFVEKFEQEIPDYFRRHKVKSGLTGWAQVNGLKGDTSIRERVRYDMYYIENWSLWFDFRIIAKTIWLLLYELFKGKYEYRPNPRLDN